ncbi:ABC transporter permease [Streptomyces sp. NPDC050560]|uniref:ABC transporter permease n=1 Tax=Streptomyces sp. NPDC050560 TaxID=3365630 RepID=UPI0037B6B156
MSAVVAPAAAARRPGSRQLAGTWALLRLALRRDRLLIPLWVLVVGGTVGGGSGALKSLYPTPRDRADLVHQMAANGSLRSLYGPLLSDSAGGLVVWRYGVYGAALVGVMSLLIVVRHTRDEEESGRQEMLSAAMVGRRAPLTAALLAALVADAGIAVVVTLGLAAEGRSGALALGLGMGLTGLLFAAVAGITAQLTESARLARGLTTALIGLAFVLRAAGDAGSADGSSALTWASPIGWAENLRPYAGERWWVLLPFAAVIAVVTAVSYVLTGRRDIGMSFLPARPGPREGRLATAGALALRLQRGALAGWGAGFLLGGIVLGGVTDGASDFVGDSEQVAEVFRRLGGQDGIEHAFLSAMVGVFGMVAVLFTVGSVLRLHGEETSGRAEPLLAGPVGRVRWAAGHLVVAYGGAVAILLLSGAGLALGYGGDLGPLLGASLVQVPAVWALTSVVLLLYGAAPRVAPAGWALAGLCLALGWLGPALDLPQAVLDLSPFGHLPKLPGPGMRWTPVVVLLALTAAAGTAGLTALRRRDLTS